MSQIAMSASGTVAPDIEKLTGDVGGAVGPDGAFNVNILTDGFLTTTGNPATNTITISLEGSVPSTFIAEDASSATPALNILNIVGTSTNGINTTAAGNTVTVAMADNLYNDFSFIKNTPATDIMVAVINLDTDPLSDAEYRISIPPGAGDGSVVWEIMGSSFYSIGVDNSDSDSWKLTNSSSPSGGDDLIRVTNAGVITLFNDLDVTEGGTGVGTFTSHGILIGNGTGDIQVTAEPSNGQLLIGSTGNTPALATLTAGTGTTITNAAGAITLNTTGGGLTWQVMGASGALAVNNGYICTTAAALSFSLPATSSVGDTISITLDGSTSWAITQGAGQSIQFGSSTTTPGVGGSLTSTADGDTITFVCSAANTKWNVISSIGNITIV